MNKKYLLVKRRPNGEVYTHECTNDAELVRHIDGCFTHTDHEILSVTNTFVIPKDPK